MQKSEIVPTQKMTKMAKNPKGVVRQIVWGLIVVFENLNLYNANLPT